MKKRIGGKAKDWKKCRGGQKEIRKDWKKKRRNERCERFGTSVE